MSKGASKKKIQGLLVVSALLVYACSICDVQLVRRKKGGVTLSQLMIMCNK